jgi:AraC family transcriptional regulator
MDAERSWYEGISRQEELMAIDCHSTTKYSTGKLLAVEHDSPLMRVETWRHGSGRLTELRLPSTEVAVMLAGRVKVERTGDGRRQRSSGTPGMFWLCPAGIYESDITLSNTMDEAIHFFLPPELLGQSALEEFEIDPAAIRLDYAGGEIDPMLNQIALSFRAMRQSSAGPAADRLHSDSLRMTLASHLLCNYLVERNIVGSRARHRGHLDSTRLRRVTDLIDTRLESELTIRELADEACLSPFHFSRMFHRSVGKTPHQYVLDRRIEKAKEMLCSSDLQLVEIALLTGFGSQSNFSRAFRKATGQSPGKYRDT